MRFNGEKLRLIRLRQRKNASEVAAYCGVSTAAVGKWEKPHESGGSTPTLDKMACAAKFLGVTFYDLCDDVPDNWQPVQVWSGPPPARPEDQEDYNTYMNLARRLRMVREALNLTPEQFGARYGVDADRWTRIESGEVRPNVSILKRLCLDHDITMDFLVLGILRPVPAGLMIKIREQYPELVNEDPTGGERVDPLSDQNHARGERREPLPFRLPRFSTARTFLGVSLTNGLFPLLAVG
jgi:transcriptional regulator with XRE-family HTH domain